MLQGIQVGSIFEEQKVFDVIVQGVPDTRQSVSSVRNLLIDGPRGGHVRLGQVADVQVDADADRRSSETRCRAASTSSADISGRSLGSVSTTSRIASPNISFPLEYHAEVLQETTGEEIGSRQMLAFAIAAADRRVPAPAGRLRQLAPRADDAPHPARWRWWAACSAALIDGAELTLGSSDRLPGAARARHPHGVLLIRHFQDLEREGEVLGPELVQRGARERFVPLVTSAVAIAAR